MSSTSATDQEDHDALTHADIGTTRTIRESKTFHAINCVPDEFFGSDRFPDHIDVVDVELVETEDMSCGPDIKITWEGDVTKRLTRRWDYHAEPVTKEEKKRGRRQKWLRRIIPPATTLGTVGLAFFLTMNVMSTLSGKMTVNGEPVVAPTFGQLLPAVVLVLFIAGLIMYAVSGGLPRRIGR